MKTYIINLERSVTRREHILREVEKCGLDYELVKAIDGSALSEDELELLCDMDTVRRAPEWLNRGIIGASLSHLSTYKKILEEGHEIALILEDDMILPDNFQEIISNVEKNIRNNEIVSLYYFSFKPCLLSKAGAVKLDEKYSMYYPMDCGQAVSAGGIVITREACKSLVKVIPPIRLGPDDWGAFYKIGGIESFRCVYPRPLDLALFKSTIASTIQSSFRAKFTQFVDDKKIPPFYQVLKFFRSRNLREMLTVEFVEEKSPILTNLENKTAAKSGS